MKMLCRAQGQVTLPTDWLKVAKDNGISENTYWQRVNRLDMSEQEAATRPLRKQRYECEPRAAVARRCGIPKGTFDSWWHWHPEHRDRPLDEIAQMIVESKGGDMVKRKVAELEGAALDWAVAKVAEGKDVMGMPVYAPYQPSAYWAQGGPLVERYRVELRISSDTWWADRVFQQEDGRVDWCGMAPLL